MKLKVGEIYEIKLFHKAWVMVQAVRGKRVYATILKIKDISTKEFDRIVKQCDWFHHYWFDGEDCRKVTKLELVLEGYES